MVNQYRPKGSEGPMYSPERDIAYIGPTLMRAAMDTLDETNWTMELREYLEQHQITRELLSQAIVKLAESQRLYVESDPPPTSAGNALALHGFFDLPFPVRVVVTSAIGNILSGAWFTAVRDVSFPGEEPPIQRELAEFLAAGRTVALRLHPYTPVTVEPAEVRIETLKSKWLTSRDLYVETYRKLLAAETALTKAEHQRSGHILRIRELEAQVTYKVEQLDEMRQLRLLPTLRRWWKYGRRKPLQRLWRRICGGRDDNPERPRG